MIIRRRLASEHRSRNATDTFSGTVTIDPVLSTDDGLTINTVVFQPGSRTFWHAHTKGQILQVVAGRGWIGNKSVGRQDIAAGDTIWTSPGEWHWHGASSDSLLVHVAISLGTTQWFAAVGDAEYEGISA